MRWIRQKLRWLCSVKTLRLAVERWCRRRWWTLISMYAIVVTIDRDILFFLSTGNFIKGLKPKSNQSPTTKETKGLNNGQLYIKLLGPSAQKENCRRRNPTSSTTCSNALRSVDTRQTESQLASPGGREELRRISAVGGDRLVKKAQTERSSQNPSRTPDWRFKKQSSTINSTTSLIQHEHRSSLKMRISLKMKRT